MDGWMDKDFSSRLTRAFRYKFKIIGLNVAVC